MLAVCHGSPETYIPCCHGNKELGFSEISVKDFFFEKVVTLDSPHGHWTLSDDGQGKSVRNQEQQEKQQHDDECEHILKH